ATGCSTLEGDWRIVSTITALSWNLEKTDGIDFGAEFFWLDDNPTQAARAILQRHGVADRLIVVSSEHDPDALMWARSVLEERCNVIQRTRTSLKAVDTGVK